MKGLFFSPRVDPNTGMPLQTSGFGPQRLTVPAELLLNDSVNIYFADFYCLSDRLPGHITHYVTVVLAKVGSKVDLFCEEKLLRLDIENNPFFKIDADGIIYVAQNPDKRAWVEVLYTENVDIPDLLAKGADFSCVASTGTSTPGGVPEDRYCQICNIYCTPFPPMPKECSI